MTTSDFRRIGAGFCGSGAPREDSFALKREDGGPGRSLLNDYQMHKRILDSLRQLNDSTSTDLAPPRLSYNAEMTSLDCEPLAPTSTNSAPLDSSTPTNPAPLDSSTSTNSAPLDSTPRKLLPPRIQVPECYRFIEAADHEWWADNLRHFPAGYSLCNVLRSERILPMRQVVREGLIAKYCPSPLAAEIKTSDANMDCLVRPYLGRRRHGGAERLSRFQAFSLRNFPLHVDQMEQLGLDLETYAKLMAEALAMMHWYGEMDANDVEFVLAPPRSTAPSATIHSTVLGEHTMWLLDFDCCRQMSMDEGGVDQAVAAFFRNDPFFPRPSTRACPDQALWEIFRDEYLQASCRIVGGDITRMQLPRMFVEKVEGTRWNRVGDTGPLAVVEYLKLNKFDTTAEPVGFLNAYVLSLRPRRLFCRSQGRYIFKELPDSKCMLYDGEQLYEDP